MPASNPVPSEQPSTAPPAIHCAFCGRDNASVGKMIAGPGVAICSGCVAACNEIISGTGTERSEPASASSTVDRPEDGSRGGDPEGTFGHWHKLGTDALLAAVRATDTTLDAIRNVQGAQVGVLRARGVSWSAIGQALGTSRQAAWERFGRGDADDPSQVPN